MKNKMRKPYILFAAIIIITAASFTLVSSSRAAQNDSYNSNNSSEQEIKWYKYVSIDYPWAEQSLSSGSFWPDTYTPVSQGGTMPRIGTNPNLYSSVSYATTPALYPQYGSPMNYSYMGGTAPGIAGSYYAPNQTTGSMGTGNSSYYSMASSYYSPSSSTSAAGFPSGSLYGTGGSMGYSPIGMSMGFYPGYSTGAGSVVSPVSSMGISPLGLPVGYGYSMGSTNAAYGIGGGFSSGYGYGLSSPVYGSAGKSTRSPYGLGGGYGFGMMIF